MRKGPVKLVRFLQEKILTKLTKNSAKGIFSRYMTFFYGNLKLIFSKKKTLKLRFNIIYIFLFSSTTNFK
ncbi:hypothetical protein D0809_04860 [Flavobacterium circumlabens]|uniref:Uncharacterized protein n=1 Tax=Flavobacterium circumlabens TaxID=2133765 RepID=A0A4Y7UIZ0_9FLAO|nr:hypothetical protein D0809_04860 [Flavobacterium circumlabens]